MEATDEYLCSIFDVMSDDSRKYRNYLNELSKKFKIFVPEYQPDASQVDVNDSMLKLLGLKDVPIQDIDTFLQTHERFLRDAILPRNGILFHQPAILLIAFYLEYYHTFLREKWPFSYESLKNIFLSLGVSFGNY